MNNSQLWPSVQFPAGAVSAKTFIYDVVATADADFCYVILQNSCFHPRDFRWPDQPADRGTLTFSVANISRTIDVLDVVKMLRAPDHPDYFDTGIPFTKRDMPAGARLLVAVQLPATALPDMQLVLAEKLPVQCQVDQNYREALSIGHSLGHLASYALNEVMAKFWRKDVALDARGFPDFIGLSQVDSKVYENGTRDTYRIGKSFRKLGFNSAEALAVLPELRQTAHELLDHWLSLKPVAKIVSDGNALDDSRTWACQIGDEQFSMFCGGTHIQSFERIKNILFELTATEQTIEMNIQCQR